MARKTATITTAKRQRTPTKLRVDEDGMAQLALFIWGERTYLGWSKAKLAEEAGVCVQTVARLEDQVTRSPHLRTVVNILLGLGFDMTIRRR